MQVSVEISLYPLQESYKDVIVAFVEALRLHKNFIVETNGMSTQIFGELQEVMPVITQEMEKIYQKHQAVLIMKMGKGTLKLSQGSRLHNA